MTNAAGWIAIVAIPVAFWVLIVALMLVVFGGRRETSLQSEAMEQQEAIAPKVPVAEPVRARAPGPGGLGWGPPVPSHH